jgi:acyl carrier protein
MQTIEIEAFLISVCECVLNVQFEQYEQDKYKDLTFHELGFDSMDTVEIVVSVEEKFKIQIDPEILFKNQTIKSLSKYIEEEVSG